MLGHAEARVSCVDWKWQRPAGFEVERLLARAYGGRVGSHRVTCLGQTLAQGSDRAEGLALGREVDCSTLPRPNDIVRAESVTLGAGKQVLCVRRERPCRRPDGRGQSPSADATMTHEAEPYHRRLHPFGARSRSAVPHRHQRTCDLTEPDELSAACCPPCSRSLCVPYGSKPS